MTLKFALLGFLSYGEMTGYDLKQCLDNSTQFFWQAKQSQIYRTLKQIEDEGLVVSHIEQQDDRPDKRIYQLTQAGLAEFRQWIAAPIQDVSLHRDAFLLKIFFSGAADRSELRAQLLLHRHLHERQGALYNDEIQGFIEQVIQAKPDLKDNALFWNATRRFGELYTAMYVTWIDEVLALIDQPRDD